MNLWTGACRLCKKNVWHVIVHNTHMYTRICNQQDIRNYTPIACLRVCVHQQENYIYIIYIIYIIIYICIGYSRINNDGGTKLMFLRREGHDKIPNNPPKRIHQGKVKKKPLESWWHGYGSIPINTIFSGMNIHLPAILMFTRGTRFWHTATLRSSNGSH